MGPRDRFRPLGQLGLRVRIAATFALGAALVSVILMLAFVALVRQNLLQQREDLLVERAEVNVGLVADTVSRPDIDAQLVFGSLSTVGRPSVLIPDPTSEGDFIPISADSRFGAGSVPDELSDLVLEQRVTGIMRYPQEGEVLVAVGVPIPGTEGVYFEVSQLSDIQASINGLRVPLGLAAAIATASGALLGWWASRRVLRPLRGVAAVSSEIADGHLDARLAYAEFSEDPDLAPLVSSFNRMVAALQDRIDRDARFASDVSHELRSPLTTLSASMEVLRNARDEMPERAGIALDLIGSDLDRFSQLVEDLLEISRFDAGAVRLEMDPVALAETIRIALRSISERDIPVVADPSIEDRIIYCDKRRVVRVVSNFVNNAEKYAGGATQILIERTPADDAAGETGAGADRVRIIVEDDGPGIPAEDRQRIFDRFYRGARGGSRGADLGVGLGLALAAEDARLQGGRVWADERPDGHPGSRFVLELPLLEPSDEPGTEGALPPLDELVTATGQHEAVTLDEHDPPGGSGP